MVSAENRIERVLWEKRPVPVAIKPDEERIIYFPTDIRYWLPAYLQDKVSVLAANGVLYITAHESFEKTRLRVQALDTQKIYLIDLMAGDEYKTTPEMIIMDKEYIENKSTSISAHPKKPDWYVRLMRFASQSLYADEHLMPSDSEITRVKIDRTQSVDIIRGGDIEAIPIAAWRGGGFYITAVRIKNVSDKKIPIVYQRQSMQASKERFIAIDSDLRGDWLAATVQHHNLNLAGHKDKEDITSLYLISARTFRESF